MGDAGFPIGMLLGAVAGIGIGISIGIPIGGKQKPWSELTERERRTRTIYISAGSVLFVAWVAVFLVQLLTR